MLHFLDRISSNVNISGKHFGQTFRANISGKHFGQTFRANISGKHFGQTFRADISGKHFGQTCAFLNAKSLQKSPSLEIEANLSRLSSFFPLGGSS
jgi:hypothetical protein